MTTANRLSCCAASHLAQGSPIKQKLVQASAWILFLSRKKIRWNSIVGNSARHYTDKDSKFINLVL